MTKDEGEGFLGRWARLKRRAAEPKVEPSEPVVAGEVEPEPEPFDPATLPDLDSLGAASDYTAFLQPGVPRELRTLALRRAWATDSAITGYKTLADYDWDFNAPGYGALRVTDNVKELADRVFGLIQAEEEPKPEPELEPEPPPVEVAAVERLEPEPEPLPGPVEEPVVEVAPEPLRRRRHGGAVPKPVVLRKF
jgi:hypothetical protein